MVSAHAELLQAIARPAEVGFDTDRLQRLTTVFQGYVDSGRLPGAVVLISRKGKLAYLQAVGYQDREKRIAMAPDSIFRIASMTKPIVTVAAMMLAEEGKLDIAAPVAQYLSEFKDVQVGVEKRDASTGKIELVLEPQKRPMTVQDLMRHTAGLVYGQFGDGLIHKTYRAANVADRNQSLEEMVTSCPSCLLGISPARSGSTAWRQTSSDVLSRFSGMTLDTFVEERITKPLGMGSTGFYVPAPDIERLAQPQIESVSGNRPPLPDVTKKPKWLSGGGGMVSTVGDYLRFAEMLLHGGARGSTRLLSPSTVSLMTSDALPPGIGYSDRARTVMADLAPTPAAGQGFGLGFAVRNAVGQNPLPGSPGTYYWTGAFGTTFWIDPKEKLVGIMMIQVPAIAGNDYRRAMRYLTYQALTDKVE